METVLPALPIAQEHTAALPMRMQDLPVVRKAGSPLAVQVMEGMTFSAILITFSYLFAVVASTML